MLWNDSCEIRNFLSKEQPYSVCEAILKSNKPMIFKQTSVWNLYVSYRLLL